MNSIKSEELLAVDNLSINIPTAEGMLKVVNNISFNIKKGEVLALVGESGCGKSMTALSLLKLLPRKTKLDGSINFNELDIVKASASKMQDIRGGEISMIFQEPMTSLNPVHKIGRQISEIIISHSKKSKKEAMTLAVKMLDSVGIPDASSKIKSYPHELSGGQRQRVMIAMALACKPALLIADEPTTALDVTIQAQILNLMKDLKEEFDTSMLFISHDLGVVAEVADRIAVMYAGEIVEEAPAWKIFKEPEHPYTKGLLASMPDGKPRGEKLTTIKGSVPSPKNYPSGCRFYGRCPIGQPSCAIEKPSLVSVNRETKAACLLIKSDTKNLEREEMVML